MEFRKWSDDYSDQAWGIGGGELIELAMMICLYLFKGDNSLVQKTVY
jgi:hypothetical protein